MQNKNYRNSNLKCNGCANTVKKELLSIEGVNQIEVDLENSKANAPTDDELILDKIKEKLSKMGYAAVGHANTMLHKAKSIISCAIGKMTLESE
jgi:copper chaperone CopZ